MRRLATIAITLIAVTLPTGLALGRAQSPSLSAPRLQASVEIDSRDVFIYRYALENGDASTDGDALDSGNWDRQFDWEQGNHLRECRLGEQKSCRGAGQR